MNVMLFCKAKHNAHTQNPKFEEKILFKSTQLYNRKIKLIANVTCKQSVMGANYEENLIYSQTNNSTAILHG